MLGEQLYPKHSRAKPLWSEWRRWLLLGLLNCPAQHLCEAHSSCHGTDSKNSCDACTVPAWCSSLSALTLLLAMLLSHLHSQARCGSEPTLNGPSPVRWPAGRYSRSKCGSRQREQPWLPSSLAVAYCHAYYSSIVNACLHLYLTLATPPHPASTAASLTSIHSPH